MFSCLIDVNLIYVLFLADALSIYLMQWLWKPEKNPTQKLHFIS